MHYLIFNNQVVDKSETPFPVAPSMQWLESESDFKPYEATLIDGVLTKNPEPEPAKVFLTPEQKAIALLLRNATVRGEDEPLKQEILTRYSEVENGNS